MPKITTGSRESSLVALKAFGNQSGHWATRTSCHTIRQVSCTYYGGGGGLQNGRGGASQVLPPQKGGAEQVLAMPKGEHKKFWGSFYMVV